MTNDQIAEMMWDAGTTAGLNRPYDSKEGFVEELKNHPEAEMYFTCLKEFGRLYTATIAADYEHQIETLNERIETLLNNENG